MVTGGLAVAAALAFGSSGQTARSYGEEVCDSLEHVIWPYYIGCHGHGRLDMPAV
jgi:hypothetical protein